MNKKRFIISSLAAAGITVPEAAQSALLKVTSGGHGPNAGTLFKIFTLDRDVSLAAHSSHSSHASHASHSSGYNGSYDPPTEPSYSPPLSLPAPPPPPPPPAPPPPVTLVSPELRATPPVTDDSLPALSGRTRRFVSVVRRVQIALLAQGFYEGPINGVVGPKLRGSIRQFQKSRKLDQTGTITTQTLDALMVSSK